MYKKFEELCKARGVTPYRVSQDLCEKGIKLSTSTLSDWKNNRYEPKVDKLIALAEYFSVSVDIFLKERK